MLRHIMQTQQELLARHNDLLRMQQAMTRTLDRHDDLIRWHTDWTCRRDRAAGLTPPDLPPPRVYDEPRSHDHEAGTSGTHREDDDDYAHQFLHTPDGDHRREGDGEGGSGGGGGGEA